MWWPSALWWVPRKKLNAGASLCGCWKVPILPEASRLRKNLMIMLMVDDNADDWSILNSQNWWWNTFWIDEWRFFQDIWWRYFERMGSFLLQNVSVWSPGLVAFNAAMAACEKGLGWRQGLELLHSMRRKRLGWDSSGYVMLSQHFAMENDPAIASRFHH